MTERTNKEDDNNEDESTGKVSWIKFLLMAELQGILLETLWTRSKEWSTGNSSLT
jgi:hypothetical protein